MKRYELKFYLTLREAAFIGKRLATFLNIDHNACLDKGGYCISSLYFDSVNCASSWEKLGGFKKREKFRIRIYNPPWTSGDTIKFEIKRKDGDLVEKQAFQFDIQEARALINGDTSPFYQKISKHSILSYLKFRSGFYKPLVIIDYFRKAFYAYPNNLRITLDYDLAASNDFKHFLHPGVQRQSSLILSQYCILEIKFNKSFPNQYKFLFDGLISVRSAVSKYVMGLVGSGINLDKCSVFKKALSQHYCSKNNFHT